MSEPTENLVTQEVVDREFNAALENGYDEYLDPNKWSLEDLAVDFLAYCGADEVNEFTTVEILMPMIDVWRKNRHEVEDKLIEESTEDAYYAQLNEMT